MKMSSVRIKYFLVVGIILLISVKVFSQTVLGGYRGGLIFPDPRVKNITAYTHSAELQFWKKIEESYWPRLLNPLEMGGVVKYTDFNNEYVGHNVTSMLLFNIGVIKGEKFSINLSTGAGGAYFSNKFNPNDSVNLAIGSHLTFALRAGGFLKYYTNSWDFRLGYYVDHYSTGGLSDPNLGANHNHLGIMVGRKLKGDKYISFKEPYHLGILHFTVEGGIKEISGIGYEHATLSGLFTPKITDRFALSLGANYFYNTSLKRTDTEDGKFNDKNTRLGLFSGIQLDFGRSLLNIHYGLFAFNPVKQQKNYQYIMYRYFLNDQISTNVSLQLINNINASYAISFGVGYSFLKT